MKNLLLIKAGKAFKTIQEQGIFYGGKRVIKAIVTIFKPIKKGEVLIITCGIGDSALYRAFHYAEELNYNEINTSIAFQDNPFLIKQAKKFKIFIFHRVLVTPKIQKMIELIKKQKKEIIFETDDLVFDPQYLACMDYFKTMNKFERKLYEGGVGQEILKDSYTKVCTTTTNFLAQKLSEYGKKVFIIRNKLSKKDLLNVREILINIKRDDNKMRLGYFSGSKSHNKDFALIKNALLKLFEKYNNLELFIAGPLILDKEFEKYKNRIKRSPYVKRQKHFQNIAKIDINLAPLELDNSFCQAKSELKFFEAGILEVPTVASRTKAFETAIEQAMDGFLAASEGEWLESLEKLINDRDLRKKIGQNARQKVLKNYTTCTHQNLSFYNYLKTRIKELYE